MLPDHFRLLCTLTVQFLRGATDQLIMVWIFRQQYQQNPTISLCDSLLYFIQIFTLHQNTPIYRNWGKCLVRLITIIIVFVWCKTQKFFFWQEHNWRTKTEAIKYTLRFNSFKIATRLMELEPSIEHLSCTLLQTFRRCAIFV